MSAIDSIYWRLISRDDLETYLGTADTESSGPKPLHLVSLATTFAPHAQSPMHEARTSRGLRTNAIRMAIADKKSITIHTRPKKPIRSEESGTNDRFRRVVPEAWASGASSTARAAAARRRSASSSGCRTSSRTTSRVRTASSSAAGTTMLPPPPPLPLFVDNAVVGGDAADVGGGGGGDDVGGGVTAASAAAAGWCCPWSPPTFAPRRGYY